MTLKNKTMPVTVPFGYQVVACDCCGKEEDPPRVEGERGLARIVERSSRVGWGWFSVKTGEPSDSYSHAPQAEHQLCPACSKSVRQHVDDLSRRKKSYGPLEE